MSAEIMHGPVETARQCYDEAERLMTICNACRYCEGHCAVFPAMERRLSFDSAGIDYLANLCHDCGSCYHHCQYAPPHEFDVDLPDVLAMVRRQNYRHYAWPTFAARAFLRNGLWTALTLVVFITVFLLASSPSPTAAGDFYSIISHGTLVTLFGGAGLFVLTSLAVSLTRYWRTIGLPRPGRVGTNNILKGIGSALSLRNLGGGADEGCTWPGEAPSLARRHSHHLVLYGFLACFAATSTGTVYHFLLDDPAPYPFLSLPKILGTGGGIAILIGIAGLAWLRRSSPQRADRVLGTSLMGLLFLTALTGLMLMMLRETAWLAPMLGVHLGSVLALFVMMPYGKFVHGLYRMIALVAREYERDRD